MGRFSCLIKACLSLPRSFQRLSIKHVQLDSLSHLLLPPLPACPSPSLSSHCLSMQLFYDEHLLRESADLTMVAYRQGTYSKVLSTWHSSHL